jgi:hypothetical protein
MTVIDIPKNIAIIKEIYAFVSSDQDGEGIIGERLSINGMMTMMPFICADKERMETLRPLAIKIGNETGKKIKLIKFTGREEIQVISEGVLH